MVRLRLLGSCDGCPSSSVTLKLAVEGAIEAAAPEIIAIEVETAAESTSSRSPVITVDSLWSRLDQGAPAVAGSAPAVISGATWEAVAGLSDLADGAVAGFLVGQTSIVGCRIGADLYAFLDRCGRCAASLATASLGRLLGARSVMGHSAARPVARTSRCAGPAPAWRSRSCTSTRCPCCSVRASRLSPCRPRWRRDRFAGGLHWPVSAGSSASVRPLWWASGARCAPSRSPTNIPMWWTWRAGR